MNDPECVAFLQWALPQNRMRWAGFRKVRHQVCKRIARHVAKLGLPDMATYQHYLTTHAAEWNALDQLCRITVSRFYRDRGVFDDLTRTVLPRLAAEAVTASESIFRAWSAGCASGEEPYSLALAWAFAIEPHFPELGLEILATDSDRNLLQRAGAARYRASSIRELPRPWREIAFEGDGESHRLRLKFARHVQFLHQDLRRQIPDGPFNVVMCRNLAFTYFDTTLQREVLSGLHSVLRPGGVLLIGTHERLPEGQSVFAPWPKIKGAFEKLEAADSRCSFQLQP